MKKSVFTVLIGCLAGTIMAQNPGEPCCSVIGINPANNMIMARNSVTGRLMMFQADAMDIKAINLNDQISATQDMQTITAINGISRKYQSEPVNEMKKHALDPVNGMKNGNMQPAGLVKVNYVEPCCAVIKMDQLEPCCNVISAANKNTGAVITFRMPVEISKTVKIGSPVYAEPVNGLAIIQSSYGSGSGELNSYGYPIENGEGDAGSNKSYVITPSSMNGVLGRLNTGFPSDVDWSIDIRTLEDKFLTSRSSFSHHGPNYDLAPGMYIFQLNTIKVKDVPIEKGKETRLKAGYLQVVSEGNWELRSQDQKVFHTSGNKPKKIALPVGSYQLKLGEQFYPVVIKDRETVEM